MTIKYWKQIYLQNAFEYKLGYLEMWIVNMKSTICKVIFSKIPSFHESTSWSQMEQLYILDS